MPAAALRDHVRLPSQITALYGSVWHGRADLTDGYSLTWQTQWSALLRGRIVAVAEVSGPDTLVTGTFWRSPRAMGLTDVTGRAGPGLLALAPGQPLRSCTGRAVVAVDEASLAPDAARAGGQVTTEAARCVDRSGRQIDLPPMTLTLSTTGADAQAELTGPAGALAQATVAGGRRLILRIESDGARLVPGMPSSAPTILEYPL